MRFANYYILFSFTFCMFHLLQKFGIYFIAKFKKIIIKRNNKNPYFCAVFRTFHADTGGVLGVMHMKLLTSQTPV